MELIQKLQGSHAKTSVLGFECKYTDRPSLTRSMTIAKQDLKLDHLYVIFPGNIAFPIAEGITARGLDSKLEI